MQGLMQDDVVRIHSLCASYHGSTQPKMSQAALDVDTNRATQHVSANRRRCCWAVVGEQNSRRVSVYIW